MRKILFLTALVSLSFNSKGMTFENYVEHSHNFTQMSSLSKGYVLDKSTLLKAMRYYGYINFKHNRKLFDDTICSCNDKGKEAMYALLIDLFPSGGMDLNVQGAGALLSPEDNAAEFVKGLLLIDDVTRTIDKNEKDVKVSRKKQVSNEKVPVMSNVKRRLNEINGFKGSILEKERLISSFVQDYFKIKRTKLEDYQSFIRVANNIIKAVESEKKQNSKKDTKDWPPFFTNYMISAYAWNVLNDNQLKELEGYNLTLNNLAEDINLSTPMYLRKKDLNFSKNYLNSMSEHMFFEIEEKGQDKLFLAKENQLPFAETTDPLTNIVLQNEAVSLVPFKAGQTIITNDYVDYNGNNYPDCTETMSRQFFATVLSKSVKNKKGELTNKLIVDLNRIPKKKVKAKEKVEKLRNFFAGKDIRSLANDASSEVRNQWSEIVSGNKYITVKGRSVELIDYCQDDYEMISSWNNIIKIFCFLMEGYSADQDGEVTERKLAAERRIKEINQNIRKGKFSISEEDVVPILNDLLGVRSDLELKAREVELSQEDGKIIGTVEVCPEDHSEDNTLQFTCMNGHAYLDMEKKSEYRKVSLDSPWIEQLFKNKQVAVRGNYIDNTELKNSKYPLLDYCLRMSEDRVEDLPRVMIEMLKTNRPHVHTVARVLIRRNELFRNYFLKENSLPDSFEDVCLFIARHSQNIIDKSLALAYLYRKNAEQVQAKYSGDEKNRENIKNITEESFLKKIGKDKSKKEKQDLKERFFSISDKTSPDDLFIQRMVLGRYKEVDSFLDKKDFMDRCSFWLNANEYYSLDYKSEINLFKIENEEDLLSKLNNVVEKIYEYDISSDFNKEKVFKAIRYFVEILDLLDIDYSTPKIEQLSKNINKIAKLKRIPVTIDMPRNSVKLNMLMPIIYAKSRKVADRIFEDYEGAYTPEKARAIIMNVSEGKIGSIIDRLTEEKLSVSTLETLLDEDFSKERVNLIFDALIKKYKNLDFDTAGFFIFDNDQISVEKVFSKLKLDNELTKEKIGDLLSIAYRNVLDDEKEEKIGEIRFILNKLSEHYGKFSLSVINRILSIVDCIDRNEILSYAAFPEKLTPSLIDDIFDPRDFFATRRKGSVEFILKALSERYGKFDFKIIAAILQKNIRLDVKTILSFAKFPETLKRSDIRDILSTNNFFYGEEKKKRAMTLKTVFEELTEHYGKFDFKIIAAILQNKTYLDVKTILSFAKFPKTLKKSDVRDILGTDNFFNKEKKKKRTMMLKIVLKELTKRYGKLDLDIVEYIIKHTNGLKMKEIFEYTNFPEEFSISMIPNLKDFQKKGYKKEKLIQILDMLKHRYKGFDFVTIGHILNNNNGIEVDKIFSYADFPEELDISMMRELIDSEIYICKNQKEKEDKKRKLLGILDNLTAHYGKLSFRNIAYVIRSNNCVRADKVLSYMEFPEKVKKREKNDLIRRVVYLIESNISKMNISVNSIRAAVVSVLGKMVKRYGKFDSGTIDSLISIVKSLPEEQIRSFEEKQNSSEDDPKNKYDLSKRNKTHLKMIRVR